MTIIQPSATNTLLNKLLVGLISVLFIGALLLVVSYNRLVNLDHGISQANLEFKKIQTENAELKDRIFALISSQNLEQLASTRKLVKERAPRYLEVDPHTNNLAAERL